MLDVEIPPIARQIGTNCEAPPETNTCSFNGLKSLTTTLEKKAGKNALYKLERLPQEQEAPVPDRDLGFQANPVPPKVRSR